MKNKFLLTVLALAFLCGGCNGMLKPVDYSTINPSIFPQSYRDVKAMVNACYYPLRASWWNGIYSTSERGVMMVKAAQTGVLRGAFGPALAASTMNYTPRTEGITYFYDRFHDDISMMTRYIYRIKNASIGLTDSQKKQAIAQIRMARALLSYNLFVLYGPIPIAPISVLKNPLKEVSLPRLSHDKMVDFIESDLNAAIKGLPKPPEAEYGRFSKGLARMVLIRLYLHEEKWEKVLAICNTMIQNGYYKLDSNYNSMWNLNGAKTSPEVIWAIPANYQGTSQNQWQMMALPPNYPGYPGWGSITSTWWFYDTFETEDVRKKRLIAEYKGTDGVVYNRNNPGLFLKYGPLPLKMSPDANRTTNYSTVDIIIYRYADVLLSKAEAIANIHGAPNAMAMHLVNKIRKRAQLEPYKLSDFSTFSKFIDMLLMERMHEFWAENGELREDLIRYGKLVDRVKMITGSPYAEDYKILWPFSPQNIVEGGGKFHQNPGYE